MTRPAKRLLLPYMMRLQHIQGQSITSGGKERQSHVQKFDLKRKRLLSRMNIEEDEEEEPKKIAAARPSRPSPTLQPREHYDNYGDDQSADDNDEDDDDIVSMTSPAVRNHTQMILDLTEHAFGESAQFSFGDSALFQATESMEEIAFEKILPSGELTVTEELTVSEELTASAGGDSSLFLHSLQSLEEAIVNDSNGPDEMAALKREVAGGSAAQSLKRLETEISKKPKSNNPDEMAALKKEAFYGSASQSLKRLETEISKKPKSNIPDGMAALKENASHGSAAKSVKPLETKISKKLKSSESTVSGGNTSSSSIDNSAKQRLTWADDIARVEQEVPGAYNEAPGIQSLSRRAPSISLAELNSQMSAQVSLQPSLTSRESESNTMVDDVSDSDDSSGWESDQVPVLAEAVSVQVQEEESDDEDDFFDLERSVRQQILDESIRADVVVKEYERKKLSGMTVGFLASLLVIVAASLGLAVGLREQNLPSTAGNTAQTTPEPGGATKTALTQVLERGVVLCGVYNNTPGFSFQGPEDGIASGLNFQLCRAISAAVFGDGEHYELVVTNPSAQFSMLTSGEIDVVSQGVAVTLGQDVAQSTTKRGFSFTYPFYFSGLAFGGVPEYVDCADRLDSFHGRCRGLRVCVTIGTTHEGIIRELMPGSIAVRYSEPMETLQHLIQGTCNVVAAEAGILDPTHLNRLGLTLNFTVGDNIFSRDPLGLVTRDGETEWSDIVNSVIKVLYTAEAMNLTKENIERYEFEDGINEDLKNRMVRVVSTVGNYGELYGAEVDDTFARDRQGINSLYSNAEGTGTGLLYSYPFGQEIDEYPPEFESSFLDQIQARGYLRCGITEKPGFATFNATTIEYSGIDVEFCRGLSAALFTGDASRVEFSIWEEADSFRALADDKVDVMAGQQVSLTNEFFEPTTNTSYFFSTPYIYGVNGTSRALATRRVEELWSSFVFWMVMAVVYAEEQGISSSNAVEMPTVTSFGTTYTQSFRDCIAAIGNYGDIYDRTLASTLPRTGGNMLNTNPSFGPQQVAFPLV